MDRNVDEDCSGNDDEPPNLSTNYTVHGVGHEDEGELAYDALGPDDKEVDDDEVCFAIYYAPIPKSSRCRHPTYVLS